MPVLNKAPFSLRNEMTCDTIEYRQISQYIFLEAEAIHNNFNTVLVSELKYKIHFQDLFECQY